MRTPIEEAVFASESAKWRATPIITTVLLEVLAALRLVGVLP